ncbi:MAG TPA: ATP-binding cassette domain-containing protein [candidate division Zixibacteria bacterium]|nr:ATP-binding cassette domain-containing protein [candidate division Zixibacteria bacterium]MDD4916359.1 ATP-binding cassette domain-containing protein [candidate division Zixibacteria bacterium]MDM7972819.1 ATP-binding cassette domain-containing protein [candidate division Zixibacteria bacterium]HOD66594.1 ATP-binding cassette domain-containing protein [candidate division Zixibacteria bacterium]HPC11448.1 ATP-binding cassette domain-containing protein [candidate division Zixibacteria bacteriu
MPDTAIVELSNVDLAYPRSGELFRNLSLSVRPGETAVITGGPGSGKTTIAELLVGRKFADAGSVEVFGENLRRGRGRALNRVRRRLGGVGGIFGLVPTYTAADNITYPLVLAGVRKRARKERLLRMLTEFSLLTRAQDYPATLTRVEQTLVQLARASIADQPLLVIDEPMAGLDTATARRVFEYLVKASLSGRTMVLLMSDHPPGTLPNSTSYVIREGRLT